MDRPLLMEPGTQWSYNGGATALIGEIIARGTGMRLEDFAQKVLFDPSGISNTQWMRGTYDIASAASGLRMTAPDLNRIGQVMLNKGIWQGTQVLPAAWLEQCWTPQVASAFGSHTVTFGI